MKIVEVTSLECIKEKDQIIITGHPYTLKTFEVKKVKVSGDGTEVILDMRKNIYFNVGMYLEGKSWVKEIGIIRP